MREEAKLFGGGKEISRGGAGARRRQEMRAADDADFGARNRRELRKQRSGRRDSRFDGQNVKILAVSEYAIAITGRSILFDYLDRAIGVKVFVNEAREVVVFVLSRGFKNQRNHFALVLKVPGDLSEQPIVFGEVGVLFDFDRILSPHQQIALALTELLVQFVFQRFQMLS